jgi:UTP:GlnB (protein PII) uridylyltransferase
MTDDAVRELARAASPLIGDRWALVALGGWGAGALLPGSDLDILVLSNAPAKRLKPFVEAVLYPLWDAGLTVGHQVRTSRQQLLSMREDLATCTAALTARPLAGDTRWAAAEIAKWQAAASKRASRNLEALDSRPRPGSPYLLEPDLKSGAGGRRDYDELVWRATLLGGGPGCSSLVERELLSASEYETVATAASVVAAARWELQRNGDGDLMSLEAASELSSVDPEAVQEALAETALALHLVRSRQNGLEAEGLLAKPLSGEAVFDLLDRGESALLELEFAAQAGRIEPLVPGMRRLMTTRRPGLGHRYTVGAHSLRTAATLGELGDEQALGASRRVVSDMRPVQVAALVHDAGKSISGPGHAERGAPLAHDSALRFGLEEGADAVGHLVKHHLLLVETALHADLDDEDTLLHCAGELGSRELLAPLHLLTAADTRATGPTAWTPWLATLVGSLVMRLDLALDESVDGAGTAARGEAVRAAALAALPADRAAERSHISRAGLRYLSSREPEQVVTDAKLLVRLYEAPPATGATLGVSAGPTDGTHAVTVAALDRPNLLASLAGVLALSGLDILSVDAQKVSNAASLYVFVVTSATGRAVSPETFSAVERHMRSVLHDRLELAVRLAERRRHYRAPACSGLAEVDVRPLGWATELRVTAPDRPGLLHDIARAVTEAGAHIRWARAQTVDGVARDTFHIVDAHMAPIDHPGVMGHVAMNIRCAI